MGSSLGSQGPGAGLTRHCVLGCWSQGHMVGWAVGVSGDLGAGTGTPASLSCKTWLPAIWLVLDKRWRPTLGQAVVPLGEFSEQSVTWSPRGDPRGLGSVFLDCSLVNSPRHMARPFHPLSDIYIQQSSSAESNSFIACLAGWATPHGLFGQEYKRSQECDLT